MLQNLSSAAVVIGALRVKNCENVGKGHTVKIKNSNSPDLKYSLIPLKVGTHWIQRIELNYELL